MRVLIVNKYAYVTAGADWHCLELARYLRAAGHDVAFLSTESDRNLEDSGRFIPLSVTHFSRDELSAREEVGVAARALWNPEAAAGMQDLVHSFRPDVVHSHKLYPQLSAAPLVVAARYKVPIVQTFHDYEFMSASALDHRGGWPDRAESRLAFCVLNSTTYPIRRIVHRRCVTISVAVSRFQARCYAMHRIPTVVIPNFTARHTGTVCFADRVGIAFVGRLAPEKGVQDLLGLAELMPDIPITVVGEGSLRTAVAECSRRLPNLMFAGRRTPAEARSAVQAARVLVVPSTVEDPGPLVALEAMAAGTPIVAYPRGGLAEYVDDAGAGQVVEESLPALAQACRTLHEDAALWKVLSLRARRAALRSHSPEVYVRRITQVYESARGRSSPGSVTPGDVSVHPAPAPGARRGRRATH